jgi:N-dimethylarginine dimethylaminohydrolase
MSAAPDPDRLARQAEAVAAAFESAGVTVSWLEPAGAAPPNLLFARDLFFMTPEGAVLARMAAEQRAGEERFAAAALAARGVPILASPRGHATFEGADALWLDAQTVLVGVGRRTNAEGFACLARALADQGVAAHAVEVPATSQHLLGALVLVDEGLALTLRPTESIERALRSRGWRAVALAADPETLERRAANLVTLAPGHVLMPAGCPRTTATLTALGLTCDAVEVGEYVHAAGALGCLTGVLHRSAISPP